MIDDKRLESMAEHIQHMRTVAEQVKESGKGIVTIDRNIARILSSIRLLEMSVTDVAKIIGKM